jgi:hypothetical protein
MANEAICIEAPKIIKRITVATATPITKGTILKISADADTGAASAGADVFGGITVEEFAGDSTLTNVAVALDGTWDIVAADSPITLGAMVVLSGANLIRAAVESDFPLGAVFGKVLETTTASERVKVRLGLN